MKINRGLGAAIGDLDDKERKSLEVCLTRISGSCAILAILSGFSVFIGLLLESTNSSGIYVVQYGVLAETMAFVIEFFVHNKIERIQKHEIGELTAEILRLKLPRLLNPSQLKGFRNDLREISRCRIAIWKQGVGIETNFIFSQIASVFIDAAWELKHHLMPEFGFVGIIVRALAGADPILRSSAKAISAALRKYGLAAMDGGDIELGEHEEAEREWGQTAIRIIVAAKP